MEAEIKKKRVLFIITQSEFGGAQRFLFNLASKLDRSQFEILVATGKANSHRRSDKDGEWFLDALSGAGIANLRLNHLAREINVIQDLGALFEIRKLMGSFRPDTLFLLSSKAGFIGSLAAVFPRRIKNCKVIYRIGGWTFNDPWPKWKKIFWIFLERLSARWKDIIVVNNKNDFDQANKLKIRPRVSLLLVHNGIDPYKLDFLAPDEARVRLFEKAAKISGRVFHSKYIIGTIANYYPAKGLENIVLAAEHFKNDDGVVFFIIGDGETRPILRRLITEKGLDKKVILIGQIPNAHRFLSAFNVFVLPSLKEGSPWSIIEAMSAKIPVVASRVGAIPEIIENGKNGFTVEPGRPEQIAARIKELLGDDRLRQEFAIQAHQTVLFKFSLDKMVDQFLSIL